MDWRARIREAFAGSADVPDADVVEELAQHLRAMYHAARAEGCSREEADACLAPQLEAWRRDAAALRHRRARPPAVEPPPPSASLLTGLGHDLRYAARLLRRQPHVAALVFVTMALGIGVSTVLFSVTYGVLLKPLPWADADRLVALKETRGGMPPRFQSFTNTAYLAWREQSSTLDGLAAWSTRQVTLTGAGDPDRIQITAATASLFAVLGAHPLVGALFDESDEQATVVVLSEGLWRQRFGGDPGAVGRSVQLDGTAYTIAGVLPDRLAYPDHRSLLWLPFHVRPPGTANLMSMFHALAKLRAGATPEQAAAEGTARGRHVAKTGLTTRAIFGSDGPVEISALPLRDALAGDVRRPLYVLLGAIALLLVMAAGNLASLQLARATTRHRELAIRAALGAARGRLVRQLVGESLLLGLGGGAAGLGLAWGLHRMLPAILPADFPRGADVTVDPVVVLFAVAVSIATTVAFGLFPALRMRRLDLVASLAEDGTAPAGAGGRSGVARTRQAIVAGQVAIACVLLVGATLLARTFFELLHADRGFEPSSVLSARLAMADPGHMPDRREAVLAHVLERLPTMPGVRYTAVTSEHPLTPGGSTAAFELASRDAGGGAIAVQASPRLVTDRYFAALGMRILAGRPFEEADNASAQPVAIVNETFARRYLGDTPVGARLPGDFWGLDRPEATVIGVAEDVKYVGAADVSLPEMYYLLGQFTGRVQLPVAHLLVRGEGDPRRLAPLVRSIVREADEALAAEAVMTLEDRLRSTSLVRPRLYAILLGSFAGFALLLTGVGLFAVLSYVFAQRTRELGVRAALGARHSDLVRLVLRQGLGVAVAGLAVGLSASALAARLLAALLYGISAHDAVSYVGVAAMLLIVAAIACLVPAYRVARLDPLRALRS